MRDIEMRGIVGAGRQHVQVVAAAPFVGHADSRRSLGHVHSIGEETANSEDARRYSLSSRRGVWRDWRSALMIVKPETVVSWHPISIA